MVTPSDMVRAVAVAAAFAAGGNLIASWFLLRRLRLRHPDAWNRMGQPRLIHPQLGRLRAAFRPRTGGDENLEVLHDRPLVLLRHTVRATGYAAVLLFVSYWLIVLAAR
jgi:hypothetical protein